MSPSWSSQWNHRAAGSKNVDVYHFIFHLWPGNSILGDLVDGAMYRHSVCTGHVSIQGLVMS
jgi:hypothetical protein